jgi:hypothetical protein
VILQGDGDGYRDDVGETSVCAKNQGKHAGLPLQHSSVNETFNETLQNHYVSCLSRQIFGLSMHSNIDHTGI